MYQHNVFSGNKTRRISQNDSQICSVSFLLLYLITFFQGQVHAREPLYSTVAAIAWWLQSTSAEAGRCFVQRNTLVG